MKYLCCPLIKLLSEFLVSAGGQRVCDAISVFVFQYAVSVWNRQVNLHMDISGLPGWLSLHGQHCCAVNLAVPKVIESLVCLMQGEQLYCGPDACFGGDFEEFLSVTPG